MVGRGLKPGWKLLGGLGLGLALWFGLPGLLRGLDFFRVRRVEIAGLQYLDPAKVIAALKLSPKASVFDDPAPLRRRVYAMPGVNGVEVGRRLPGTLEIELIEAVPVALATRGDGLALLDARGRVLPFDPLRSAPDLPLAANGDAVVTGVLARVRDSDPDLFARIGAAWRVGPDVVLEVGGRRLWFGAQVSAEDIRAVTAVEQALARSGRAYQELDGRFAGQVIVRRTRA
ncbi:MAG TPA: FtsQ-type POTRA domain-containing protein [Gemmatimonadales bacterium]|nr:FtsQ-type POTRA domain-containing protein [Gemmatimonadales bacterium]